MNKENGESVINIVKESQILDDSALEKLKELKDDLERGFTRRQRFRPRFLMEVSVLNDMKYPTPDAKYWQCNVERDTHFRNLTFLSFDYKEKIADINIKIAEETELRTGAQTPINQARIAKVHVQIEREKHQLIYMEKEARERIREILNWTDIMKQLEPELKYSKDNVEEHMPESYAIRFKREAEAMKIAGACNASELSGAMNLISLEKSCMAHPAVRQLVERERTEKDEKKKKEIEGGEKGENGNNKKILGK